MAVLKLMLLLSLLLLLRLEGTDCACTFPPSLVGTWVTSTEGNLVINSTHILSYPLVSDTTGNLLTVLTPAAALECFDIQDTKYALKSEPVELFNNLFLPIYTCLDIEEESDIKLIYYKATAEDPVGSGLTFTVSSDTADICSATNYKTAYGYRVALKSGSETTALTQCPSSVFGTYNYNCSDPSSTNTTMNVCDTRQQFVYNYTMCSTPQLFSMEGVLDCVYFVTSGGVNYLTMYNRDSTTPDETSYYRYVCLAIQLSGSTVQVSANPKKCTSTQTPTTVDTGGELVEFSPYYLCPLTTEEGGSSFNWLIVAAIVGALVLIALIIIIICCCLRRRRKKKKEDEESIKSESDSEAEEPDPVSRRSSRSSRSDEEEKKSIDSGISEPPTTGRTTGSLDMKGDDGDEKELVINAEGDKEIDDKTSRPRSGQRSRMSDLPPSTIPPDEDAPHHRTEDEENKDEVDEQKPDDEDNEEEKEDEPKSDHEQEEEEKENEPESDEDPKPESEPEPEPEPEVNPEPEPEVKPEPEPEDKPEDEEQKQSEDEESKKSSDEKEKQESESSDSEQVI